MTSAAEMNKLNALNNTLGSVENELLQRHVAQLDTDLESAVDVIHQLADAGHVEICPCDGEGESEK